MRWVGSLALALACGCGRLDFDPIADGTQGCVGTSCGPQCSTNCFPLKLYEAPASVPEWGLAIAAMPTGEVHVIYIDPVTNTLEWLYSDSTLRHWSAPVDLTNDVTDRAFSSVALVRYPDSSLNALVMDSRSSGSTLYRRQLIGSAPGVWSVGERATVALPDSRPISIFSATTNAAGTTALALATDGGDTTPNSVYVTRSYDGLRSLQPLEATTGWDLIAASVTPRYLFEAHVEIDSGNQPWVLFHDRTSTNDDANVFRYTTMWTGALPPWGDPWHYATSLDSMDVLHVFYEQEGTVGNPQTGVVRTLSNISGSVSIGNWSWGTQPSYFIHKGVSSAGDQARLFWEDPATSTLSVRDTDGTTWSATTDDLVGMFPQGTTESSALAVAPQMIQSTSHILWRTTTNNTDTVWYMPYTRCGGLTGPVCAADQACMGAVCVPR